MRFDIATAIAVVAGLWVSGVEAAPVASPLPSWTGCYAGVNAGASFLTASVYNYVFPGSGELAGGQIGCDYQFAPKWVLGIAGAWDSNSANGAYSVSSYSYTFDVPWVATATARIGYTPSPDVLLYAKGGIAWNNADVRFETAGYTYSVYRYNQTGWTAGLGAEWRKNAHWSMFAEYDYTQFDPSDIIIPAKNQLNAVLFGLNFRFNGK